MGLAPIRVNRPWLIDRRLIDQVKLVAPACYTGRTGYMLKLSTRLTPGNDALHR